jgi:predicted ATPase
MSAAHGGQVLASQTARDLLDARDARDLGMHRLKDVGELRLFQLGEGTFPPLRSLNNTNLPARLEPLIGRKRELAELLRSVRIERARLFTLTGPGGIGKTRLALELAREVVPDFEHGVWLVDLSAVRDAEYVLGAIAAALGAKAPLAEHVGDRELLLVLDNFEQVVGAASQAGELLESCPRLQLLVTSREALRIAGEREYSLRPLADAPAVELFRQRVDAAGASLDADYSDLVELCRWLDNLPLAIELAAARAKTLSVEELGRRLERRLPTLAKGRRDAPERQRTLRATIAWSFDLLSSDEQAAFVVLAVFSGGWTLAAAEDVVNVDAEHLDSLVDKSLIRRIRDRFSMLETIREFACEHLEKHEVAEELRHSHAEWVVALGHAANMNIESDGEQQHGALTAEAENIRAALDWARARCETELEIRILFALENWWVTAGPTREALARAKTLLPRAADVPPERRAQLLRVLANNTTILEDEARGAQLYADALEDYRRAGDDVGQAAMVIRLAFNAQRNDDFARARALSDEVRQLLERVDVPRVALQRVQLDALLAFEEGDHVRAFELFRKTAVESRRLGFVFQEAVAVENLAWRLRLVGRVDEAIDEACACLALAQRIGDREYVVFILAFIAACAADLGDGQLAGRLWGAIEAHQQRKPMETWERTRARLEEDILRASVHSGFGAARLVGSRLELDEAAASVRSLD